MTGRREGPRPWQEAGVAERIELRLGLALSSFRPALAARSGGCFDLVYVDADKKSYDTYYERARAWCGRVASWRSTTCCGTAPLRTPKDHSRQTVTMRALNAEIRADERVSAMLLRVGDGLTLARRR